MSNAFISYTAKRGLVDGTDIDDSIGIAVTLTKFDHAVDVQKTENTTLSGRQDSRLRYINDTWSVEVSEDGTVTLDDGSTVDLDGDYMEMFLRSVAASESFNMSNIDDSDNTIEVQLVGSWSRSRRSERNINSFSYSFKIRAVI